MDYKIEITLDKKEQAIIDILAKEPENKKEALINIRKPICKRPINKKLEAYLLIENSSYAEGYSNAPWFSAMIRDIEHDTIIMEFNPQKEIYGEWYEENELNNDTYTIVVKKG